MRTSPDAIAVPADLFLLRESAVDTAVSVFAGLLATAGLFAALSFAQTRHVASAPPAAPPEELRAFTLPPEPPPAPPSSTSGETGEPVTLMPLATGLAENPSDSSLKVGVSPLQFDLTSLPATVPEEISIARSYPTVRPNTEVALSESHIYRQIDVDQRPQAIKRSLQFIPHSLRVNLYQIRVVLVILMEKNGKASSVRIAKSCGTPALDDIVVRSVREDWEFSPALKRGKPVRCLVQQAFLIKFDSGSLLEAN